MSRPKSPKLRRPGYYFKVWAAWFESPAFRNLSPAARCLLMEFLSIYRPGRNGQLSISVQGAMDRVGCSKGTAQKAFRELAEHGFIKLKEGERWQERRAREFALTIESVNGHEPTDDWRDWQHQKPVEQLPRKRRPRKGA